MVVIEPTSEGDTPQITGVLTDRDIVIAVVAKEADIRSLSVGDVMTRDPLLVNVNSHSTPCYDTCGTMAYDALR